MWYVIRWFGGEYLLIVYIYDRSIWSNHWWCPSYHPLGYNDPYAPLASTGEKLEQEKVGTASTDLHGATISSCLKPRCSNKKYSGST